MEPESWVRMGSCDLALDILPLCPGLRGLRVLSGGLVSSSRISNAFCCFIFLKGTLRIFKITSVYVLLYIQIYLYVNCESYVCGIHTKNKRRVDLILSPFSEVNPPQPFFSLHVLYYVGLFFTKMEACYHN